MLVWNNCDVGQAAELGRCGEQMWHACDWSCRTECAESGAHTSGSSFTLLWAGMVALLPAKSACKAAISACSNTHCQHVVKGAGWGGGEWNEAGVIVITV